MYLTSLYTLKDHWNRIGVVHKIAEFRCYVVSNLEEFPHLGLHSSAQTPHLGYIPVHRPPVEVRCFVPECTGYILAGEFFDGIEECLKDVLICLFARTFQVDHRKLSALRNKVL